MTLNQLAWEMWESLGFREIEPGALSRIMTGERKFTISQLKTFCKILKLSEKEANKLTEALKKETLSKYGIELIIPSQLDEIVNYLEKDSEKVKLAIFNGAPLVAKELAEQMFDFIDLVINQTKNKSVIKKLLKLKLYTMIDYVDSLFGNIKETDLYGKASPYISQINHWGEKTKDDFLFRTSYTLNASLMQLTNRHQKTFQAIKLGLENGDLNEQQTITAYKAALVSAINTRRDQYIKGYARSLSKNIDHLSDSFQIMTYYSLASAEASLGNLAKADYNLSQGWGIYNKLNSKINVFLIPRRLSLANAEILIALKNPGFRDKNYLDKLCNTSREIAGITGFYRIKEKFENFNQQLS